MQSTLDHPSGAPAPSKLLFVHSGSPKKRLTFEAATSIGIQVYLFNPEPNWAVEHAQRCFFTRGKTLAEVVAEAEALHRREPLGGVVTFWEEDVPTTALIARRLGLPGNSLAAAFNARSKYRMRRALERAGVPVPRFAAVDSTRSLLAACKHVGVPAILKPEWGSDSEWVARVNSPQQALEVLAAIRRRVRVQDCIYPYRTGRFVLEGLLRGPEVSVEGVVQQGKVTLYAIIDKAKMDEMTFIERGECTPSLLPAAVQEEIAQMVRRGVAALGLRNSGIHAEVKVTEHGPRIVEIGARMGGDCIHALVKRVYGTDLAVESIRVALGLPVQAPQPAQGYALSRTLVPEQAGRVYYRQERALRRSPHLIEVVLTKRPGDRVALPPEGYDNLAWVSVWGRSFREAEKRLEERAARLEESFHIEPEEHQSAVAAAAAPVAHL
ncbi:MAG: ATP-grasp domain-containing protein [Candidatus Latescibacterota bacterium]